MADRLVSINTASDPGEQLPAVVQTELGVLIGGIAAAVWKPNTAYAAGTVVTTPTGILMARKTTGVSPTTWVADRANWAPADAARRWSVTDFGATGDGTTDDTAAIQAALDACHNKTVVFPAGTFNVAGTVFVHYTTSVEFTTGATIKAVSSIAGPIIQWGQDDATGANGFKIRGRSFTGPGFIDCNDLANTGLWVAGAGYCQVSDLTVRNGLTKSIILGGTPSAGEISVEITMSRVRVERSEEGAIRSGSYGVWMTAKCTDSVVRDTVVVGSDICFRNDGSGNRIDTCHGWGWYTGRLPSVIFDDNGFQNVYTNCEADSPTQYGFRMRQLGFRIIGGWTFVSTLNSDNTVTGIYIDQNNPSGSITGHGFIGSDGTHRLAKDVDMTFSLPSSSFAATGNVGFNVAAARICGNDTLRNVIVQYVADGYGNPALRIDTAGANSVNLAYVKNGPLGYEVVMGVAPSSGDAAVVLNLISKGGYPVRANGVDIMTVNTIHALTAKTTPVDADELVLVDTAASNALKKLTWANLKSAVAAYMAGAAPAALDTLTELATALGNDANFATTVTNALAAKASLTGTETLTGKTINLTSNTLLGTFAQFNTALTDGDFALAAKSISGVTTATFAASFAQSIADVAIPQYNAGRSYLMEVWSRDESTGAFTTALCQLLVTNESGTAAIVVCSVDNKLGTSFGLGAGVGTYGVSATVSANGLTITPAIKNNSANGARFGCKFHQ